MSMDTAAAACSPPFTRGEHQTLGQCEEGLRGEQIEQLALSADVGARKGLCSSLMLEELLLHWSCSQGQSMSIGRLHAAAAQQD